jgi:hypothetical protein
MAENNNDFRKSRKWLEIRGISFKEVYTPCGSMQRGEFFGKPAPIKPEPPQGQGVFSFGKYRGQTIKEIQKKDPGYVNWCINTVKGFKV